MKGALVDFNLRRQSGRGECLSQDVLGLGLRLVVAFSDGDQVVGLDRGDQPVRAVWLVGHQPAAVERCARANTIGQGRGRTQGHGPAHAVSNRPDLAGTVYGLL